MRGQIAFLALIITFLSLSLASCGGGATNIAATALVEPALVFAGGESQIPAMPPGGDFNPVKITAAVTAQRNGVIAYDHNAANVSLPGPHANFAPAPEELAWAIYEFPGSTADDISNVEYFTSNRDADGLVWMAISNYDKDAWDFLGARNLDHGAFNPPGGAGEYASPAGHMYVMVLAWDGVGFDLDQVTVTYANRYAVTGQVVDMAGVGIPMTTVTTTLGGPGVMTDAAGNFTLPSIPEGTWHIMATKPAWVFYDNPQEFTVSGGPLSGVQLIGDLNQSHFDPIEDDEPNDAWWLAPNMDPSTPIEEFVSVSDDPADYYRFAISTPGQYYFRLDSDPSVLFPHLILYTKEGLVLTESSWITSGVVYVPVAVATTRVVIVKVSCSGGGGNYVLSTGNGYLHSLSGFVKNTTPDKLEYIPLACDAGSEVSYLYTRSFDGKYFNNYMAPLVTTVTPDPFAEDPYTYVPVSAIANLNLGDATLPDFIGSAVILGDLFEPNDTSGTAHVFGSLPVSGEVANINGTDGEDWYRFTPTAGKHIIARLHYDYARTNYAYGPISIALYNHDQSLNNWGYNTDKGLEVRSSENMVADGNEYYFKVYIYDIRTYNYTFWIEEVDAYKLEVGALWKTADNSFGLENARIDLYSPEYNWTQTFSTAHSGLIEVPFLFKDGEELFVEIFRYGTTLDRYTKHFTIAGDDIKSWFSCYADECEDVLESNDEYGKYVDYPADFDATISSISDPLDRYLFTPASTDPLHVSIDTPGDGMSGNLELWDNVADAYLSNQTFEGGGDFYFETAGMIEHRLEVSCWTEGESPYHITIDETPGFKLSGTLLDNVATPVGYSYIYCPALDYQFHTWSAPVDGNYELGPFPPGSYQIYVYAANYDSVPVSPWTLNVAAADVVQDFVLNLNYTDVGEPNGTSGTASGPLVSGVPVEANINQNGDTSDYWSFTVGAGGPVNAYITFEKGFGDPQLKLYDIGGMTELASSSLTGAGYERIDYILPVAGTYFVAVNASGANDYTIAVNY